MKPLHVTLMALLAFLGVSSHAATVFWSGAVDNNWNTPGNWSTGLVPGSADTAQVDTNYNSPTVITSDAANPVLIFRAGWSASRTGIVAVAAKLRVEGTTTSEIARSGDGTLYVQPGGIINLSGPTGQTFRFGVLAGSVGRCYQTGGTVTMGGTFSVGVQGLGLYDLSDGYIYASNNLTVAASSGQGVLTQSGGSIIVGSVNIANSGQSYVGQSTTVGAVGAYYLTNGLFWSRTLSIGQGSGGRGMVEQMGGTIDLLTAPYGGGSVTIGANGVGTYSIENGTLQAIDLAITNGSITLKSNATLNFTGVLNLAAPGTNNFKFHSTGVSKMTFTGTNVSFIDPAAQINVDGSGYTGGDGTFTLIEADSFDNTPIINLTGFALGATYNWDTANGKFTVIVGQPPPTISYTVAGNILELTWPGAYLNWYAQSNATSLANPGSWYDVPGSNTGTNLSITLSSSASKVFYRLRKP